MHIESYLNLNQQLGLNGCSSDFLSFDYFLQTGNLFSFPRRNMIENDKYQTNFTTGAVVCQLKTSQMQTSMDGR